MRLVVVPAALLACVGCMNEYHPEYHPVTTYTVSQTQAQNLTYSTVFQAGGAQMQQQAPEPPAAPESSGAARAVDASRVVVIDSPQLERPGEVIGVIDLRVAPGTGRDAAVAQARQRAAELGADAVVGIELHAVSADGSPHVSGLAVRFAGSSRNGQGD